jgi:hypothetical protein
MTDEVVVAQTFEQKMKSKIRDSIGDLISEDELSKMITRSVEEVFFTKRPNPKRSSYGHSSEPEFLQPFLHEIVKECLQPTVSFVVSEYIKSHPEIIKATINDVVVAGVGNAVVQAMNMQFQNHLFAFQSNIMNQLNSQPR